MDYTFIARSHEIGNFRREREGRPEVKKLEKIIHDYHHKAVNAAWNYVQKVKESEE